MKRDRKRTKDWSYYVVTHDWPVGVGTVSEGLSREDRYRALDSFDSAYKGAMTHLADTKPDNTALAPDNTALSPECVDTDS